MSHYQIILNYFDNKSTKSSAEMKFMNSFENQQLRSE
jgi:hypothetical protein